MTKSEREYYLNLYKEELFTYCAPFWLKHGQDTKNGGLLNCLDEKGEVYSTDKSVWMQGRCAWLYSHLSNLFGENKEYLALAKSCLDFENKYCFDADGRMYFTVTADGKPLRKRRYWFSESFYVNASIEYYMATKEVKYLEDARKVYDMIYGIFDGSVKDPFEIFPKVYPKTRSTKAMAQPMILLNVSSIMREGDKEREELYNKNIDYCLKEIKTHYFEEKHAMLENVSLNNEYIGESAETRVVNPGHDLECAYFIACEAKYRNDKELLKFAEVVFKDAIARGWDEEFGGILYFKDVEGKCVEAYEHDMKLWWTHNEGINAAMLLYSMTGDEYYFDWFKKITEYAFSHFSEHKYGEWYGYLRRDGKVTEPPCKGHTYKGPFHVMRSLSIVIKLLEELENK